jgi:hypothetical protein
MRFTALFVLFMAFAAFTAVSAQSYDEVDPERDPAPPGYTVFRTWAPAECRKRVQVGDEIHLMYTARIAAGSAAGTANEVFDHTTTPVVLHMRGDALITGLYRGLIGSCIRERRRITIPALWAYGPEGFLDVPGNATVMFDVDVFDAHPLTDVFGEMDSNNDGCVDLAEVSSWVLKQGVRENLVPAIAARMLAHDDANKDGRLTCDEFSGSKVCRDHRHKSCARRADPNAAAIVEAEAEAPTVVDAPAEAAETTSGGRPVGTMSRPGTDFKFF